MKPFIHDDFLLETSSASRLYHEFARDLPIIDYHCHLEPAEIARDISWENLTQVWLQGDHYKWRAMRSNGISEKFCTGSAPDYEKFLKFASSMPYMLRNPLYHWSHMELARYFDVSDCLLSEKTAPMVWKKAEERLSSGMSARSLMIHSKVELVCTTDDPLDSLEYHIQLKKEKFSVQVLPTWRPDTLLMVNSPSWEPYVKALEEVTNTTIGNFSHLISAVEMRHEYFHSHGCRLSDHSLAGTFYLRFSRTVIEKAFQAKLQGKDISEEEALQLQSAILFELGRMDAERGWTKQIHLGALRNNNTRMLNTIGANTGFDSIDDQNYARPLSHYLDALDSENCLPRVILYNLNPKENAMIATMLGNFQDGSVPGKIQMGSGWWFLDNKEGMEQQMNTLSNMGLLRRFIGMLTDSRSFLSYPRHEYFRRILCNLLGKDMEAGLIPMDYNLVGSMVEEISYKNAKSYFSSLGFRLENM